MLYVRGGSYFKWCWHLGYLKYLRFAAKNLLCLLFVLFFSLLKYFFLFPLSICFTLALVRFLISTLSLRYFSTSCNTLRNSVGDMSPSYIACEMISVMLSNLLWASSIMASCFPCFTVRLLENFRVGTVKRERTTPNPPKAAPTGRPTQLANAGIEAPPEIAADVIKPVSMMRVTVFNRFFFLASRLVASI